MVQLLKNKFGLLASFVFLTTILLKPIHQLSHLEEAVAVAAFDLNTAHVQEFDHCQVCDFQFTPSLDLEIEALEIPILNIFISKEIILFDGLEKQTFYSSNRQLRAPPFNA